MSRFTSYYLYQRYEKVGDGEWTPTYPNEYSISGDSSDPMPLVIKEQNDANCGYYPPIYQWVDTDDTICIYEENNPYAKEYLTIDIVSGSELTWSSLITGSCSNTRQIYYSVATTADTSPTSSWLGPVGSFSKVVRPGQRYFIKGLNNEYGLCCTWHFGGDAKFNVHGNIMSMIYGDDFVGKKEFTEEEVFNGLFKGSGVLDASNLVLPAEKLTRACYAEMFRGCSWLTAAPLELSGTTLADSCYAHMFYYCINLETAPSILPATTLANTCYAGMFSRCNKLRTAPELPAETLVSNCYYQMFYKASLLNNIKCLATDISATDCTKSWVTDVWANGTFTKAASMSNWTTGNNGIPNNWTIQNA